MSWEDYSFEINCFLYKDGVAFDGLLDVYNKIHMGNCAENTAKKMSISRQDQDTFALRSYRLSAEAYKNNILQKEIVEVRIPQKKGTKIGLLFPNQNCLQYFKILFVFISGKPDLVVSEDEEYKRVDVERFTKLPTAFLVCYDFTDAFPFFRLKLECLVCRRKTVH